MWHRVFGLSEIMPQPAEMQSHFGWGEIHVRGDELGWTSIESPELRIERYLPEADDIRDELDAWAAWIESQADNSRLAAMMQQIISTKQLFTFQSHAVEIAEEIAKWLADKTNGVYQIDSRGFFESDGSLIVDEN